MTIREDAGLLLKLLYDQYTGGNESIGSETVFNNFSDWGDQRAGRINRAINYLRDINAIKITLFIGNYQNVYNFSITGLTNKGVELIENRDNFQIEFGFRRPE